MSDSIEGFVPVKNFVLIAQKAIVLNENNEVLLLKRSEKVEKEDVGIFAVGV